MNKELENLLDNYENAIYGQAFPITPSTHQLHLLLDYIEHLEQQCKKQKEIINKTTEYIKERFYFNEETGEYSLLHTIDKCNAKELLDILNEVSE